MVKEITKNEFESLVINSKKKVLVDFYASWCGPCRMLAPNLVKLQEEEKDIEVYKVNVDEEGELSEKYGVYSIPSIFVFEGGKVIKQEVGFKTIEQLKGMVGK